MQNFDVKRCVSRVQLASGRLLLMYEMNIMIHRLYQCSFYYLHEIKNDVWTHLLPFFEWYKFIIAKRFSVVLNLIAIETQPQKFTFNDRDFFLSYHRFSSFQTKLFVRQLKPFISNKFPKDFFICKFLLKKVPLLAAK